MTQQQSMTYSQSLTQDEFEHCVISSPHLLQQFNEPAEELVPLNQAFIIHVLDKQHTVIPLARSRVHIDDRRRSCGQKADLCTASLVMFNDLLQLLV